MTDSADGAAFFAEHREGRFNMSGSAANQMVVTFTDETTELSGMLLNANERPAPEYFVAVFANDEKLWESSLQIKMVRPDVNGRYVFAALVPGAYRLAVTTDMGSNDKKTLDVRVK